MGAKERLKIIQEIQRIRKSRVITYVVSTRPKITIQMDHSDVREIFDHISSSGKHEKLDLFIYSNGGVATVAWCLANLVREFSKEFCVLVPFNSFSCATSLAMGSDKIIMGHMGTLGPVDPTVANEFNPIINNQLVGISVEDISGFITLFRDKFGVNHPDNLTEAFKKLASDIRPLALGNAYRHYLKARDDARKLLELHMNPKTDKDKIDKLIELLVEKLYYHGHHINRSEAKNMGLNVVYAEDVKINRLMWDLYLDYEAELQLRRAYEDALPSTEQKNELPVKFIESEFGSSAHVIEQNFVDLGFNSSAKLTTVNNQPAVFIPPNQFIPVVFSGQLVSLNNKIYDKQETNYWKFTKF